MKNPLCEVWKWNRVCKLVTSRRSIFYNVAQAGRWSVSVTRPPRRPCPAFIDFLCALSISFVHYAPAWRPRPPALGHKSDNDVATIELYLSHVITMPDTHFMFRRRPLWEHTVNSVYIRSFHKHIHTIMKCFVRIMYITSSIYALRGNKNDKVL